MYNFGSLVWPKTVSFGANSNEKNQVSINSSTDKMLQSAGLIFRYIDLVYFNKDPALLSKPHFFNKGRKLWEDVSRVIFEFFSNSLCGNYLEHFLLGRVGVSDTSSSQ